MMCLQQAIICAWQGMFGLQTLAWFLKQPLQNFSLLQSNQSIKALCRMLHHSSPADARMAPPGLHAVCDILQGKLSPPPSNFLSLAGFLSPAELALLVEALRGSRAEVGLRLRSCALGDIGATALATALRDSSITSLELPGMATQLPLHMVHISFLRMEVLTSPGRCRQRNCLGRRASTGGADGVQLQADFPGSQRCRPHHTSLSLTKPVYVAR